MLISAASLKIEQEGGEQRRESMCPGIRPLNDKEEYMDLVLGEGIQQKNVNTQSKCNKQKHDCRYRSTHMLPSLLLFHVLHTRSVAAQPGCQ